MPTIQNEIIEEVQSWLAQIQQEVNTLEVLLGAEQNGIDTASLVVEDAAEVKGGGLQIAGDMKADDTVSVANISALVAMFSQQLKDDASFRSSVTGAQGDQGQPGERGQQGPRGDAGEKGAPGASLKGEKGRPGRDRAVGHSFLSSEPSCQRRGCNAKNPNYNPFGAGMCRKCGMPAHPGSLCP